ncbi:general L-amino acid transport system permease protein [Rhodoligotrophos appendicifer]|uniref:amino acid ABC transporter permease n=1 Tax=Rhodoligotrophos appendicifer TaxID=987056 RepID=UPI001186BC92|nr:amino acid ABC transporter permease [Rhodoligotrophos appendicifer]
MSAVTDEVRARDSRTSFWNDPKIRGILSQALLILVVGWFAWEIIDNTVTNLQERRIASGYRFLENTAGFGIVQTLIPYSEVSSYGRAFVVGLLNTLLVAGLSIVAATLLGFVIGIMRLSKNWLISKIAAAYVEVIRNVPLLLQLFVWYRAVLKSMPSPRESHSFADLFFVNNRGLYAPFPLFGSRMIWVLAALGLAVVLTAIFNIYAKRRQEQTGQRLPRLWVSVALILGLPALSLIINGVPVNFTYPELQGFNFVGGINMIPEFVALFLGLSIYTASFIAEVVRAGIQAVSKGQTEAGNALGLRGGSILRLIVVPQAMRVIVPPLANQYLNLTKNSSLAVAIGYPDVVATGGTVLNQTGQAVEVISLWMAVYLTLSLLTSGFMNWFNARIALVER